MFSIPESLRDRKVFFLAGPIRGSTNWQEEASRLLWRMHPRCIIANPGARDEYLVETDEVVRCGNRADQLFISQSAWESHHMLLAAKTGSLFFWFGNESKVNPRCPQTGPYGQDTRVEVGIWVERLKHVPNLSVHFGTESPSTFKGLKFIHYYIKESGFSLRFSPNVSEFIQSV